MTRASVRDALWPTTGSYTEILDGVTQPETFVAMVQSPNLGESDDLSKLSLVRRSRINSLAEDQI